MIEGLEIGTNTDIATNIGRCLHWGEGTPDLQGGPSHGGDIGIDANFWTSAFAFRGMSYHGGRVSWWKQVLHPGASPGAGFRPELLLDGPRAQERPWEADSGEKLQNAFPSGQ